MSIVCALYQYAFRHGENFRTEESALFGLSRARKRKDRLVRLGTTVESVKTGITGTNLFHWCSIAWNVRIDKWTKSTKSHCSITKKEIIERKKKKKSATGLLDFSASNVFTMRNSIKQCYFYLDDLYLIIHYTATFTPSLLQSSCATQVLIQRPAGVPLGVLGFYLIIMLHVDTVGGIVSQQLKGPWFNPELGLLALRRLTRFSCVFRFFGFILTYKEHGCRWIDENEWGKLQQGGYLSHPCIFQCCS